MFTRLMRAVTFFINTIVLASIVAVTIAHAGGWEIKKREKAEAIECLALNIYWETRAVSMADAVSVTDGVVIDSITTISDVVAVVEVAVDASNIADVDDAIETVTTQLGEVGEVSSEGIILI